MDAKIFRVNYKSDFILTLTSDAGWMTPFCIKFWTGSPMLAYYASYDGTTHVHCTYDPSEPTKLTVQFDDHHLTIGNLKYQVAYHFTVADFPENTEDEVTNQANVTTVIDGDTYQVMLDLNGETAPEIQFALPAYANELQRIQNEQTRIAQEQQRISQEQQRINQEAARVTEFNGIKAEALADHQRANEDHSRATYDHQNALADRSQAAGDHSRAQSDHSTADRDHLQASSDHTRAQSDHNTTLSDHQTALSDHTQANTDHTRAESDHTRAMADSSTAAADHRTASTDHTQANTDHARAESDHQRVETDLAEVEEFSNSLGPYDISAAHATGSTLATYPDLATALGQNGSNIPEAIRKGGMSVKFVLTYDNKYVQFRLMAQTFSTDVTQWQGIDDIPTAGSDNLVKSGGVAESYIIHNIYNKDDVNCVDNKYVNYSSGNLSDSTVTKASGWIPIIGGKYYIASYGAQCAWYDSEKTFISGEAQGLATAKLAPSNAAYLRYSFRMDSENTNRINEGDELFPYSAYNTARTLRLDVLPLSHDINDDNDNPITSAAVKKFADEELSKDFEDVVNSGKTVLRPLNDSTDITNTSNGYYNTVGEFKSSTSFKYQKVTIDHTKAYHIYNNVGSGYGISTLVFFDEDDKVIYANGASIALDNIIIFPSYIKSFVTCGVNSTTINILEGVIPNQIGLPQMAGSIFPVKENETVFFEATRNTFLPESSQDGVITDAGFYPSYTNFTTYFNIPVSPNKTYCLSINGEINSATRVKSLDANGNYINGSYISALSGTYITPANAAYIVCTFQKEDTMNIQLEDGSDVTPYIYPYVIKKKYLSEIQLLTDGVDISLPDKIYAVVGDTIQLFYNGMIKAVDPFVFNIITNCSKGAMYPRYWQYTPNTGDIGTTNFTLKVLDNNRNVIAEKTTSLVTVAAPVSPSTDIHVLAFGDSLTAGGIWPHECDRRLTGSGGTPAGKELNNITFCGSKVKDGTHYFGAGGWTWINYTHAGTLAFRFVISGSPQLGMNAIYSNNGHQYKIIEIIDDTILGEAVSDGTPTTPANWEHYQPQVSGTLTKVSGSGDNSLTFTSNSVDSANPLWDSVNNKMSFIPYANEFCDGQIDVVYIMMTWNGLSPANWKDDYSNFITEMNTFANTLHTEFPDAKLKLMAVQFPSVKRAMPVYGASGENHSDVYGALVSIFNMNKAYQDWCNDVSRSSWCEFVNVSSQFDSDYCNDIIEKNVNTRVSTIKEYVVDNGVHPKIPEGYYQIADVVYRNFVANFCQSN